MKRRKTALKVGDVVHIRENLSELKEKSLSYGITAPMLRQAGRTAIITECVYLDFGTHAYELDIDGSKWLWHDITLRAPKFQRGDEAYVRKSIKPSCVSGVYSAKGLCINFEMAAMAGKRVKIVDVWFSKKHGGWVYCIENYSELWDNSLLKRVKNMEGDDE